MVRHLRSDYDHIQPDPYVGHNFGDDEPVFLIRAKDPVAPDTLHYWAMAAESAGADPELCAAVRRWANEMDAYRQLHWPEREFPDTPAEFLRKPEGGQ